MELMDLKVDYAFKELFGSQGNEEILIALLNALLKGNHERIEGVEIRNSERSLKYNGDKKIFLDILAVDQSGSYINVEIQLANEYNMVERSLYYWAELYYSQLKKAERYRKLKKTIAINILNYSLKENRHDEYHTSYHITEDTYGYSLTDKLELHFIELPKLATQYRLENELDQWMMLLHVVNKDVVNHELFEKLRQIDGGGGIMKRAIQEWETLSKDENAWDEYRARKKAVMDEESRIDSALWNQKIETTERMLNKGVEEKDIMDFLELTKEEFREIIEQVKDK